MASIVINQLDEATLARLRLLATGHGRTVEEEAGEILKSAVLPAKGVPGNLGQRIRRRIEPLGGIDLPEIKREPGREPPTFV